MNKKKFKEGFSMIEMLVVVALIGILSVVLYSGYSKYIATSKETAVKAEVMEVADAFRVAMVDHKTNYGQKQTTVTKDNYTSFSQLFDIDDCDLASLYAEISDSPLSDDMILSFTDEDYLVLEHKGITVTYDPVLKVFITN